MNRSLPSGPSLSLALPLLLFVCRAAVLGFEIVDPPPNRTDILQNCSHSYVLLSDADNYTLLDDGTALMLQGNYYNVSFYDDTGNFSRPVICLRLLPLPIIQPSLPLLFYAVFLTVLCLAIIASTTLLITYSLFRKLRTLPGKVIMNLAVAFLAGDAAFLIYSTLLAEDWLLVLVGYFFYARFMWMALAGFEICHNIYNGLRLTPDSEERKNKFFIAYLLIGWGEPLVPTIITAVVHYTSSNLQTHALFGIGGYVSYLVPIGLTVLFNAGAVIFLSIGLRKATVYQKQFNRELTKYRRSTNYGRVFLIVLTALGFTWISVFLARLKTQNLALIAVIILVNASQPIFVSIAFIGTKKVVKQYLGLCGCRKEKKTEFLVSRERSQRSLV